jgi:exonuclease SbcC
VRLQPEGVGLTVDAVRSPCPLLSTQNRRRVVIAVRERELFDYLAFELSTAYEGDEFITIEVGERATEEDQGITRHLLTPEKANARLGKGT